MIDNSGGSEKSFILLKKEKNVIAYISNISALTLSKRIKEKNAWFL